MYHGVRDEGAKPRSKNAGKKKRRRGRKKRNPSLLTWGMIAGVSALAVGGGIAYMQYRKKKKALPPTNGGQIPSGGGGRPSGGGGGGARTNAPEFPYSQSEARDLENTAADAEVAEAFAEGGGQIRQSVNSITDDVFYFMYKIRQIPAKAQRGTGWDPYVQSWMRIHDLVSSKVASYGGAVA